MSNANPVNYQPTKVAFGLLTPLDHAPRQKRARRQAMGQRALTDLEAWQEASPVVTRVEARESTAAIIS